MPVHPKSSNSLDLSDNGRADSTQSNALLHEDLTITNWVRNYTATGDVASHACKDQHFKLEPAQTYASWIGWCSIYKIVATLSNENSGPFKTKPYYPNRNGSGALKIVQTGTYQFEIQRVS